MRYPGCVNGRCNLPWECICDAGWHGRKCDQVISSLQDTSHIICQLKDLHNTALQYISIPLLQPGEGPTTPAYVHKTYPPGHGLHGHSIDHPNNHGMLFISIF